ncbi:DUF5700 domain-containing putative Zn-dependent protease [Simiduia agarivorans]|uniref:DUF2268 domain-containing protein n=1 Tax=Simiduia agarivorans (strain DSM 21679 / JCM 13881 / BCRC 17597 / SA1) TaxID=1117647 RepID=K4KQC9_SIMAS|nr:DUF5700 domain-containing putative Zn-dependent protease [Simiduia agarivorans]AFV00324.1 hypothetical protein M5M_15955 [Simiduia agarivorans SA1 = DSM 21679]
MFLRFLQCIVIASVLVAAHARAAALPASEGPTYDFAAAQAAIALAQRWQAGQPPTEPQWQALIAMEAYQLVFSISSLTPDTLRQRFRLAFDPAATHEWKNVSEFEQQDIHHLRRALNDTQWLQGEIRRLPREQALEKSITLAQRWLPADSTGKPTGLRFVFGLFGQNAHASAQGVVMDAYLNYRSDQHAPYELGAHELHHFFRRNIAVTPALDRDSVLDRLADHLIHEGVANLIDKQRFLQPGSPFSQAIKTYLNTAMTAAPDNITKLNQHLETAIESQQFDTFSAVQQDALPLWGHSVGWYMTQTIVRAGLDQALANSLTQPRDLFRLYNTAAIQLNEELPLFSKKVLQAYAKRAQQ